LGLPDGSSGLPNRFGVFRVWGKPLGGNRSEGKTAQPELRDFLAGENRSGGKPLAGKPLSLNCAIFLLEN
jgi:hypothetical protein